MIVHDATLGQISDGEIRYVIVRADVLMRIADHLPEVAARTFLAALEQSVAHHASGSFEQYRADGAENLDLLLQKSAHVASLLGWGRWRTSRTANGGVRVIVEHSPFAAGFGDSAEPVCSAISGALRAMFSVQGELDVSVSEEECAAQGARHCRFHVDRKA